MNPTETATHVDTATSSSSRPGENLSPSEQPHSPVGSASSTAVEGDPTTENDESWQSVTTDTHDSTRSLVPESRLSSTQRARLAHCGHPIVYHRADGATEEARHRCGQTFCSRCQMARTAKIRACSLSSLEDADVDRVWMVTLTLPHSRRLTKKYLYRQLERVRTIRARAMSAVRTVRSQGRGVEPVGSAHASEYLGDGDWRGTGEDFGYLWALQITPGGRVPGWHPHLHVLVTTEGGAQCLRAAWVHAARSVGVDVSLEAQDISATAVGDAEVTRYATRATEYVSGRVASLELAAAMSAEENLASRTDVAYDIEDEYGPAVLEAYLGATKNLRRYDAGGTLRPLGVGARERRCTTCGAESSCGPRSCIHEWCDGRMVRINPVVAISSQAIPDLRVEPGSALSSNALHELGDVARGIVVEGVSLGCSAERTWLYPSEEDRADAAKCAALALSRSHNRWRRDFEEGGAHGLSNQIEQSAQMHRTPLDEANDHLLDQLELRKLALGPP